VASKAGRSVDVADWPEKITSQQRKEAGVDAQPAAPVE
jgi:hypothetical protein